MFRRNIHPQGATPMLLRRTIIQLLQQSYMSKVQVLVKI